MLKQVEKTRSWDHEAFKQKRVGSFIVDSVTEKINTHCPNSNNRLKVTRPDGYFLIETEPTQKYVCSYMFE